MTSFALVTLGCEKNTVDSERYLAQLVAHGAQHVDDPTRADVILVNTCGFIDAAKKESLDAMVDAGRHKVGEGEGGAAGHCRAVVAIGCMVERYREEMIAALPEVDLFIGASEMDRDVVSLLRTRSLQPAGPGRRRFSVR